MKNEVNKTIKELSEFSCNGCKMCADLCPKNAIVFQDNERGFWVPIIKKDVCIKCGACLKNCPHINGTHDLNAIITSKCAWSQQDDIRLMSTSGGIFFELGQYFIQNGGYVVGCKYDDGFKKATHSIAHDSRGLLQLVQSKYLQSDTANIYKEVSNLLKNGNSVLFVGTPCQNAALSTYLRKPFDNLIQVEFICRGITSPLAHLKYIEWLEAKHCSKLVYFRSKEKSHGWNNFGSFAKFENGEEYFSPRDEDPKVVSYHSNLTVRESCTQCAFRGTRRPADITLADFWGVLKDSRNPKLEMGTSAVLINTEKGDHLFNDVKTISSYEVDLTDVLNGNPALSKSLVLSKHHTAFFKSIDKLPYDRLVKKFTKRRRIKRFLKKIINLFKSEGRR